MQLMDSILANDPGSVYNHAVVLRDQFIQHATLRRELKRLARERPHMSMWEIREEAIRWVQEGDAGVDVNPTTWCQAQTEVTKCSSVSAGPDRSRLRSTSEFVEMKELRLQQQQQIQQMFKQQQDQINGQQGQTSLGDQRRLICVYINMLNSLEIVGGSVPNS